MSRGADGVIDIKHDTLGQYHLHCTPSPPPAGPAKKGVVTLMEGPSVVPELMFANNESNNSRLWNCDNKFAALKDAFHDHIVADHRPKPKKQDSSEESETSTVAASVVEGNEYLAKDLKGTKAGANYDFKHVPGKGGCVVVRVKLTPRTAAEDVSTWDEEVFDDIIDDRREDADEFYASVAGGSQSHDLLNIQRQALAGMLWYACGFSGPC